MVLQLPSYATRHITESSKTISKLDHQHLITLTIKDRKL